ncbi:MAG: hypothetical protein Q8P86_04005 [bacterium]|nr:hypothetical protein [bacterium]
MKSNIIIPAILILASVGLFFMYVNPKYSGATFGAEFKDKSIKELQAEKEQYAQALDKTAEIEKRRKELWEEFNGISQEDRDKVKQLLPDHVDSVRLAIDLSAAAFSHSLSVRDIAISNSSLAGNGTGENNSPSSASAGGPAGETQTYGNVGGQTGVGSVNLGFTVSGSYDNFKNFMMALERSLRVLNIVSLSFSADSEADYEYKVDIETYFLK